MNYKQMVLFEELVDVLSQGSMRVAFGIGPDMCLGEFRKPASEDHVIDSERLLEDYWRYAAEDTAYFKEIKEELEQDEIKYAGEKFLTIVFNHVYAFLEENVYRVDDYLTGYDEPGVIYHLYKFDQYYEEYVVDGVEMEPFRMVEVGDRKEDNTDNNIA